MYRNDMITTKEIERELYNLHYNDMCFRELVVPPTRIDFLALNPNTVSGNVVHAYEIKTSVQDFRKESKRKQRSALLYSDQFWYIAPVGVIPHDDIPVWAGLKEIEWTCTPRKNMGEPFLTIKETLTAPRLGKDRPSWGLVVSLIRNAKKEEDNG